MHALPRLRTCPIFPLPSTGSGKGKGATDLPDQEIALVEEATQ